jgi:hypothetical protein
MNVRARSMIWLVPFVLTACSPFHHHQVVQDKGFAPPTANLPRPPVLHPELPETATILPELPLTNESDVEPEDVPPPRRHKAPKPVQQASNALPAPEEDAGVSAIGTLSSGETPDQGQETNNGISAAERSLNGLGRNLSPPDLKTAAQVREYLKQAKEALITGDVDGAHTLLAKAKVLLSELAQ